MGAPPGGGNSKPHFPACCAQTRCPPRSAPEAWLWGAEPRGRRLGAGVCPCSRGVSARCCGELVARCCLGRPGGSERRNARRTEVTGRLCAVPCAPAEPRSPQLRVPAPSWLVHQALGNSSPVSSKPNSAAQRVWAHYSAGRFLSSVAGGTGSRSLKGTPSLWLCQCRRPPPARSCRCFREPSQAGACGIQGMSGRARVRVRGGL